MKMKRTNIPAGHQLHITTWENDADAYQTEILSGLTEADVKFYLSIITQFYSRNGNPKGLGNGQVDSKALMQIFQTALQAHPSVSDEIRKNYTIEPDSASNEEDDDESESGDQAYELIGGLLGFPVNEGYDGYFCRVFASHQVFLFETAVTNVTKKFPAPKTKKTKV